MSRNSWYFRYASRRFASDTLEFAGSSFSRSASCLSLLSSSFIDHKPPVFDVLVIFFASQKHMYGWENRKKEYLVGHAMGTGRPNRQCFVKYVRLGVVPIWQLRFFWLLSGAHKNVSVFFLFYQGGVNDVLKSAPKNSPLHQCPARFPRFGRVSEASFPPEESRLEIP